MRLNLRLILTCGVYILCRHFVACKQIGDDLDVSWYSAEDSIHCFVVEDFSFTCSSTVGPGKQVQCIHKSWVCDGDPDCPEGEDEGQLPGQPCHGIDIEHGSNPDDFQCTGDPTVWIPKTWMCDGDVDCVDSSDEAAANCLRMGINRTGPHAHNIIPCPPDQYQCGGSHKCIPLSQVCDQTYDCDSWADEQSCYSEQCDDLDCTPCVETSDGARCICDKGFYWSNNTCVDINECDYEQYCDHKSLCINTPGNFTCTCKHGYQLEGQTTCHAIHGNGTEIKKPSLVLSNHWDIRQLDMNGSRQDSFLLERGKEMKANDFVYKKGKICWVSYLGDKGRSEMRCSVNNKTSESVPLNILLTAVHSFAIDWVTENWYFTDLMYKRVSVCSANGLFCQLIAQGVEGTTNDTSLPVGPQSIVLDPRHGQLYYTDWSLSTSRVMTASMDGHGNQPFVSSKMVKPNALAIDYANEHLYWADVELDTIDRIDLTGDVKTRRIIALGNKADYVYSIGVFENFLYLSDRHENSITRIHRYDYAVPPVELLSNLHHPGQLRVHHQQMQPAVSVNPCENKTCPQICALKNDNGVLSAQCLCGAGFIWSGSNCTAIEGCPPPAETIVIPTKCSLAVCQDNLSYCSKMCLPSDWWCDSNVDCPDGSDEGVHCTYDECEATQFTCESGACIDVDLKCNGIKDCGPDDDSDEKDCEEMNKCTGSAQFRCDENTCLPKAMVCDGIPDCHDQSDENITICGEAYHLPCADVVEFTCRNGECISTAWVCDGDMDCLDGTDELDCNSTCISIHERQCDSGTRCIPSTWFCDGEPDCQDFSDESDQNCPNTTNMCNGHKWLCEKNGHRVCLEPSQLCDKTSHCDDDMDENRKCAEKQCDKEHSCSHLCYNSPDGYMCDCPLAMKLDTDNKTCVAAVPMDKLCDQWGICGQLCVLDNSTQRGYRCTCLEGFFLEPDDFTCKPLESDPVYVIFSNRHELRRVDIITRDAVSLRSGLRNTIALDFCYNKDVAYLFWTDVMEDKIFKGTMSGNNLINVEAIVASGLATTEGVAVDWVAGNIYWVESTLDQIEVAKLDGTNRTTLVAGLMASPRAIVLDPRTGQLFWTDWDSHNPRIETCSMSGEGRKTIHTISPQEGGGWPNGLTIDYDFRRLYWTDARSKSIHSINYDGSDVRLIIKGHDEMSHPFAMSLFGNYVYWTDWSTNSVVRANKFNGSDVQVVQKTITQPFGLQVMHPRRQPQMVNPCAINNGNCSDLCLLSFNNTIGCRCPHRKRLKEDGRTCVDDKIFLVYVRKHEIRGVDIDKAHFNVIPVITIPYVDTPTAINYDHVTQKLYWADKGFQVINTAGFNANVETLIDKGLNNVEGFAIDWLSRNLYFSSHNKESASISVAHLSGSFRTEIIKTGIKKPTAIAIQPYIGLMFFLDVGNAPGNQSIYRAKLDGSSLTLLVSGLTEPKSLICDVDDNKIYVINNKTILSYTINGFNRTVVTNAKITDPTSLTVYGDSIFISTEGQIVSIKKNDTNNLTVLRDSAHNVTAMIMYDVRQRQIVGENKCHKNQSLCSQLCLTTDKDLYKCKCTDGFVLTDTNCTAVKSFLLYAKETEIRGTLFESQSTLEALAPISQIQSASALDFLASSDLIFWVDQKANTISRIRRDLTGREVIISDGLNSVEGLAVDWVAGHIYWTDAGHSTIEVSKINGQHRYVLISGDMEKPRSIVVNPKIGYLYWSDWGTEARIERARLDGSGREQYIYTDISKPWGMTIDYDTNTLYWCDIGHQTIEAIDLMTDERRIIVQKSASLNLKPVSLTVFGENIFWIDRELNNGSVYKADKTTGANPTLVREGLTGQLKDIKAYDTSRHQGTNLCQINNGGCGELCFYIGEDKVQCACSFGKLNNDQKNCDEYKGYLMFSKVTAIEFINLNDSNNKNPPNQPIKNDTNLKNVIGLTYDFEASRIFYSDIQRGDIQMVGFNGQNISVVVEGVGSAEGLAYEKVKGDLYWTSYTNSCISRINVENSLKNISRKPEVVIQLNKQDNPRAIVVDSCWGLLYWTNWNSENPRIQRSNLAGINVEDVIVKDILTPNGLTIDHKAKKLYWSDARLDKIERCEMDGSDRYIVIRSIPQHSFGLAVYDDYLFWTDWMLRAVIRVNKYDGTGVVWLRKNLERQPMGIVAIANDSNNCELHPCHNNSFGCQDKCFTDEVGRPFCQCTYGKLKADGKTCSSAYDCSKVGYEAFPCRNGMCLRFHQSCDGKVDCTDGSDEAEDSCKNRPCPSTMFTCTNRTLGQCIPLTKKCDHNIDCKDGSDESSCDCPPQHWKCKVGPCIPKGYRCDGKSDCLDNSDELGCDVTSCPDGYVSCNSTKDCIPEHRLCDGQADCDQGTDEANCNETSDNCGSKMFRCGDGACIYENWLCDKDFDCVDHSDETGCNYTCQADQFQCQNDSHCISNNWLCDGNNDCADGTDEKNCSNKTCNENQFQCSHGRCIDKEWTCDGEPDCRDGLDEGPQANCTVRPCGELELQCANYRCVDLSYLCDGDDDCGDNTDEPLQCHAKVCDEAEFRCANGDCIDKDLQCNGIPNCRDSSDEKGCPSSLPCGGPDKFMCANTICINDSDTCNGHNDCGDNSDEPDNCGINECDISKPCSHICTEKKIGFSCQCRTGFTLRSDNVTCEDVDECHTEYKCSHFCVNTIGSFYCTCAESYQLASDKRHCILSNETDKPYLLVSNRYFIQKVGFDGTSKELVTNLTHSVAIDFDYQEQMLYWTDIHSQSSTINRIHMNARNASEKQILHSSTVLNPDGIAVDWVGRNLYWCDRNTDTVEVSKLNGLFRKILVSDKNFLREPRALEVFPKYGWLFVSDWGDKPHISRIAMDGKFKEHIITEDIAWPNALTIDYVTDKLFWADANYDYIAMADLDGQNRRSIINYNLPHTFALTTFMDFIFWTDWETNGVYVAQKFTGDHRKQLATLLYRPMDMVVYHKMRQISLKRNPCDGLNCTHLCLLHPETNKNQVGASCACPEHHKLNEDKQSCTEDCDKSQFLCNISSKCIPLWHQCDGNKDCEDGTDETDCDSYVCEQPGMFQCKNATASTHCILPVHICDGNAQCSDGSDESYLNNCADYTCLQYHFKCEKDNKCIGSFKVCDGHADCSDKADEKDCDKRDCLDSQFRCNQTGTCIPYLWQCDGDQDCSDGSDEDGCKDRKCKDDYIKCANSTKCIPKSWECDGEFDCGRLDDTDEKQSVCSHVSCEPSYFKCNNGHCIPGRWYCDHDKDCSDGSDEENCQPRNCTDSEMQCEDKKKCIPKSNWCNGLYDCHDQSDEANCTTSSKCTDREFQCVKGSICIPGSWKCDGEVDCIDGSDEDDCNATCDTMEVQCTIEGQLKCIPFTWVCDAEEDCDGGLDEKNCSSIPCPPGKFRCEDHTCIPSHKECNNQSDCKNGRDEDKTLCSTLCPMNQYRCQNSSKCLLMDQLCNGYSDCPAGDDEDINTCNRTNWTKCKHDDCEQQCDMMGSIMGNKRRCSCGNFTRLAEDSRTCVAWDPCERFGLCDQKCIFETKQQRQLCYCEEGYQLWPEKDICISTGKDPLTIVVAEENRLTEQTFKHQISHSNISINYGSNAVKIGSVAVDTSSNSTDDWLMFVVYPGNKTITKQSIKLSGKQEDKKTEKGTRNTREVQGNIKESVFVSGLGNPQGVAVDWVGKNVYWTDAGTKKIEMKQYGGSDRRRTMIRDRVTKPFAIAVDPNYGKIFWTELGYPPRIESANLDGTNRSTLVPLGVLWPTGLAIDYPNKRLYWADMKSHTIESTTLEGKDRTIVKVFDASDPPYLVDVFESTIYVTTYKTRQVMSFPKFFNTSKSHNVTILRTGSPHIGALLVYQSSKQAVHDETLTNACKTDPCPSSTQMCINKPGGINQKYTCLCPDGAVYDQVSKKCNFKQCRPDYCQNNGTCTPLSNTGDFKCSCLFGFYGKYCEVDVCKGYCLNGADCIIQSDKPGEATCKCPNGYSGKRCQNSSCDGYCSNGGTCVVINQKLSCNCIPGFKGSQCETYNTTGCDKYCENNGVCSLINHGQRRCNCTSGYTGLRCEQCLQESTYCYNGGVCEKSPLNGEATCRCQPGWDSKTNCQNRTCDGYCMNRATCSIYRNEIQCNCRSGFKGERCDEKVEAFCKEGYCQNGGTCHPSNEVTSGLKCICRSNYSGDNCQNCKYCQNGGNCSTPEGSGSIVCTCPEFYKGLQCEKCKCNNGECVNTEGVISCSCHPLYSGRFCDKFACKNYCFNDGECIGCYINNATNLGQCQECKCKDTHSGERCQAMLPRLQEQTATAKTMFVPILVPIAVVLCILLIVILIILIRKRRNSQFRHSRLKDGPKIANPVYRPQTMEDDEDESHQPLDHPYDFDPEKSTNFSNPVYDQCFSNDSHQQLLVQNEETDDEAEPPQPKAKS